MYLIGAEHPNRTEAAAILERLIGQGERLVTDAEVFQEVLYRYDSINRRDAIQPAFDVMLELVSEVFPITIAELQSAKELVLGYPQLNARDAIHIAVMRSQAIGEVLTFDKGYDVVPGILRISL